MSRVSVVVPTRNRAAVLRGQHPMRAAGLYLVAAVPESVAGPLRRMLGRLSRLVRRRPGG